MSSLAGFARADRMARGEQGHDRKWPGAFFQRHMRFTAEISAPKIEPISRNPGIGIGVGVGIGIDIEISIDSDLDSESDSDPDTDPDADKQSGHVIFMRLGARHAHDGLLRV